VAHVLPAAGGLPNNPRLPLVVLPQALPSAVGHPETFERTFAANGWGGSWRNGVYATHHYHSTAHEVLGVYRGRATVQMGGPGGLVLEVTAGDAVVIPAGVAHKRLRSTPDFAVVGAYPPGLSPDLCYGKADEQPAAEVRIAAVPLPDADPVFGPGGPLCRHWSGAQA